MSALVVVNPRSGGGRTRREWRAIERALESAYPNMTVVKTRRRGDATALVREALLEGCSEIVAVGGDGTINEAVNGFFAEGGPIAPDAVFAFVTSGTGGDFRKSFGIAPGYEAAIARLKSAKVRTVDVGRVSCLSRHGAPVTRHFINIASFGMSGVIVDSVNRARIAKLFGGKFAFAFHSLMGMLRYRDRAVRIRVDGALDEITRISTVAVANGLYFGGGMKVAPNARPDDGLFDVIVMGGTPKSRAAADMKLIYTGEHLNNPAVRALRGSRVVAVPVAETGGHPVLVEVDGESAGRLPATFEILPRALNLRC
ncbi:MAG: diacylglycerol kinase family lipid kinase [Proteobacteria bacterium]|jgi:YegS/Rv2252/BmrU family lipid kinase|nr:diacylglycerol kinase family lipid kinase [Pseudomonadota bacterium]